MIPPAIRTAYSPEVRDCTWTAQPPGGGLSGGRVWRGERNGEPRFALKRWQTTRGPRVLQLIHNQMRRAGALDFVPKVVNALTGESLVEYDGRCWDVTTWLPGKSSLSEHSEQASLSAIRALGQLHHCWRPVEQYRGGCSAIHRRRLLLSEWKNARLHFTGTLRDSRELNSATECVGQRVATCVDMLSSLTCVEQLHTHIHGDFWPENVLFVGHRVSAVLDFGNASQDWPEVDVARFLAELPPLSDVALRAAAEVYESANAGVTLSVPHLKVLIATGPVCSLANWLLRFTQPDAPPRDAALPRIRRLVSAIHAGGGI